LKAGIVGRLEVLFVERTSRRLELLLEASGGHDGNKSRSAHDAAEPERGTGRPGRSFVELLIAEKLALEQ